MFAERPYDSRALVEQFYNEVWNRSDETTARKILSPRITFRGSIGEVKNGVDGFIEYLRRIHAVFADYHCEISELVVEDDCAAARMMFTGVHRGSLWGEAPTRRQVSWAGAAFFACSGGQIDRVWVLGDTEALKRALNGIE
jgi:predicted ester cyclase